MEESFLFTKKITKLVNKSLVDVAYKRATKVLTQNRLVLDELANMLVEKETINSEDLQDLIIRSDVKVAEYV